MSINGRTTFGGILATLLGRTSRPPVMVMPIALFAAYGELARQLRACLPHEHGRRTVQELLYVADVLHVARTGRRMYPNEFMATAGGPACELLFEYQKSDEGMAHLMHEAHRVLVDDDMRDAIADVVDKLGHANKDTIRHYSQGPGSAFRALFIRHIAWIETRKGPSITTEMVHQEAERRYAKARPRMDAAAA